MRSSKSRSRSKSNRNNRSVGNVVNRVFDSSGPEGKVRGTPQQIIDKYNQLTRDAQLSNDRVAAENFQQHAEHYLRMLAEAMREQQERQQQQQDRQNQQRGNDQQGNDGQDRNDGNQPQQQPHQQRGQRDDGDEPARQNRPRSSDVIDVADDSPSLVETPENNAPKPRRTRRKPPSEVKNEQPETEAQPGAGDQPTATPDAAE